MAVSIRKAHRSDALHVAAIVDIAGHGIDVDMWRSNMDEDGSPLSAARSLILDDPDRPYHLSRAFILEIDKEIAGGVIGSLKYDYSVLPQGFPAYMAPLLELESRVPMFWSVLAVAICREFRGKGLARSLLDFADGQARSEGARGLSIVVEDTNLRAITLYRRFGFKDRDLLPWLPYGGRAGPQHWVLLTLDF